jgi:hypothetical protein
MPSLYGEWTKSIRVKHLRDNSEWNNRLYRNMLVKYLLSVEDIVQDFPYTEALQLRLAVWSGSLPRNYLKTVDIGITTHDPGPRRYHYHFPLKEVYLLVHFHLLPTMNLQNERINVGNLEISFRSGASVRIVEARCYSPFVLQCADFNYGLETSMCAIRNRNSYINQDCIILTGEIVVPKFATTTPLNRLVSVRPHLEQIDQELAVRNYSRERALDVLTIRDRHRSDREKMRVRLAPNEKRAHVINELKRNLSLNHLNS